MSDTCEEHGTKLSFQPIGKEDAAARLDEIQLEFDQALDGTRGNQHLSGRGKRERSRLCRDWDAAHTAFARVMDGPNDCACALAALNATLLIMSLTAGQLRHIS